MYRFYSDRKNKMDHGSSAWIELNSFLEFTSLSARFTKNNSRGALLDIKKKNIRRRLTRSPAHLAGRKLSASRLSGPCYTRGAWTRSFFFPKEYFNSNSRAIKKKVRRSCSIHTKRETFSWRTFAFERFVLYYLLFSEVPRIILGAEQTGARVS